MTGRQSVRPRIIWDLDDTLNELMKEWLVWRSSDAPVNATAVDFASIRENPPHRLLHMDLRDYLASLDRFRNSSAAREMRPVQLVAEWFEKHGFAFEHHVVTARPVATVPAAAEWVFRHFGRWVRHFHFTPARRANEDVPDSGASKRDIISQFSRADFFVDDSADNLEAARGLVGQVLLVPQPWNGGGGTIAEVLDALTGKRAAA
jgi:hypothetical protein